MVTVNMLKPYYIKAEDNYLRIILAYQYFSVLINQKIYQFIPVEAKEIRIHRRTGKVENVEAKFAFQKGKEVIYMTVSELMLLPDFVDQLHSIAEPYYINETAIDQKNESAIIVRELEHENVKRLIDKALDEQDKEAFHTLVKYL
ncbi:IDEAL domain-containing protein [Virgibacillus sp. NKC19-3]|uniref:IDEAL domain-containing protein n=1 Tax=Virgibacillus saliphilus TaxID=2831674 RepID=UPI001C9AEB6D|nr:IDEAL domain-containing protein [Virgibacillus sp. NKC19-3]MBY7144132.1 IDEAL domain-containing protein [Virgibacillus sp. NKC19-3]